MVDRIGVPTPEQIQREWLIVAREPAELTGDLIEKHRESNKLLDLYIDLGYLGAENVVLLEQTTPPEGYEQIES